MDRDFRAFLETPDPGVKPVKRRRGCNAFGWTICLLLLTGAVMASWIGSIYISSHPENPDCYHFLKKLNRIEPLKRFEITAAPAGKFFTAKELYDTYLTMSQEDLDKKNSELLRNYLRNYSDAKTPVSYICGRFTTIAVCELGKSDMFPTGMVAVADSTDCPQVQIEHIYPTAFANVPRARQMLATDPDIHLEKAFNLTTIVHVGKLADGRMRFTVIPIDYGQCAYKQGISSTFRLDPPSGLNLEAGLPLVKPDAMENAAKTFALYRKNKALLAKGRMLTLPASANPAISQATDFYTAQDIPPEAFQPYKPADPAPPAAESAPENTVAAAAPPLVTPPAGKLPPVSTPSSGEIAAQTIPEPPSASVSTSSPVAPISQPAPAAPVVSIPATSSPIAPISRPAPAVPATSIPVIPKTSLPSAPSVIASSAPATAAASRATAPAKLDKPVAKILVSASSPAPAPAMRSVARYQLTPSSPEVIAAFPHATVSKANGSTPASTSQAPVKTAVAPVSTLPAVERAQPYPSPAPVEYSEAVPPESRTPGVKLDPFLVPPPQPQQQIVTPPVRVATWETYRPGLMPRGKLINIDDVPRLADLGIGSDRLYVNGRFVVTASSDGRAVLRPVNYSGAISGTSVRMVVEYPAGSSVPMEGAQVTRGTLRPFQIIDVRRGNDGQVNIYAREITVPVNQASPYAERNSRYRVVQQDYNALD